MLERVEGITVLGCVAKLRLLTSHLSRLDALALGGHAAGDESFPHHARALWPFHVLTHAAKSIGLEGVTLSTLPLIVTYAQRAKRGVI